MPDCGRRAAHGRDRGLEARQQVARHAVLDSGRLGLKSWRRRMHERRLGIGLGLRFGLGPRLGVGWIRTRDWRTLITRLTARCEEGSGRSSGSQSCSNEMGSTQPAASSAPPAPESFVTLSAETIQSGHLHIESGNWPPPPFIDEILTILSVASGTTRPRLAVRAANSSGMGRSSASRSRSSAGKGCVKFSPAAVHYFAPPIVGNIAQYCFKEREML